LAPALLQHTFAVIAILKVHWYFALFGFGLLLFHRLTNGFTGSALPYMDECDHTTVLSMMPFAIFYLLQPVMKVPYPLLNDMI